MREWWEGVREGWEGVREGWEGVGGGEGWMGGGEGGVVAVWEYGWKEWHLDYAGPVNGKTYLVLIDLHLHSSAYQRPM